MENLFNSIEEAGDGELPIPSWGWMGNLLQPPDPPIQDDRSGNDHAPSSTSSVSVLRRGSQASSLVDRPAPRTPSSNFNIEAPEISSGSSAESLSDLRERGEDDDAEDIFPRDSGIPERIRELARRRLQDASVSPNDGSVIGCDQVLGDDGTVYGDALRRRRLLLEGRADNSTKDVVMCIVWASGRIAASYYDLETGQIFILPEMTDSAPDFEVMRNLFANVQPTYVIANKSSEDRFLLALDELTGHHVVFGSASQDEEADEDQFFPSGSTTNVQLYLRQFREFSINDCKDRVLSLKLPSEPKDNGSREHVLYISSIIPFSNNDNLIRSLGCLLKFLDKSAIELFQLELVGGQVPVTGVELIEMHDIVLVDDSAWNSLQIFSTEFHPSSLKQGAGSSSSKEGLSVYSLLNQCTTIQGSRKMRHMLLCPSRNRELLERRYDTIEFCMSANHLEFVKSASDCLKSIKSIPKLLHRVSLLHATVNEWKDLYQTFYHSMLLGEICSSMETAPDFVKNIGCSNYLSVLRDLTHETIRVVDFEKSASVGRIVSQEGIDPELDKKKKQYACLPEIMSIVASEEMGDLPAYVTQCCTVYIPEVGYLLAVTLWRDDLTDQELLINNLEFRFKTNELAYYKSARMRELDVIFGDCSVFILEKETILMVRLTEMILRKSSILYKINDVIAEFDCLLSMAGIAKSYDLTRPTITSAHDKLKILNGRHPISDMVRDFVPNSTIFRDSERVVILTGPNASGKSVYLKQVGMIVIMALSGSFVPAEDSQIPLFDRICTRIHAKESVSSGFSTFMIDINQVAMSLRSSTKNSLVIIDEFGKGTAEADGLSILTASLQDFIDRGDDCPTVFLSTHYFSITNHLKPSPLVKFQTMKFFQENDVITYLYKLEDGYCNSSFAQLVAKANGMDSNVIQRANEIEKVTRREKHPDSIQANQTDIQLSKEDLFVSIADEFLKLDLSQIDPVQYLDTVKKRVDDWESFHDQSK